MDISLVTMLLDLESESCRPFCAANFVHDLFSPLSRKRWTSVFSRTELPYFVHLNHSNISPNRNSREISGLRMVVTANVKRSRFICFCSMNSSSFVSYLSSFLSAGEIAILTNTSGCGSFLLPQSIGAGNTVGFDATSHCLVNCCVPCPPQGTQRSLCQSFNPRADHQIFSIRSILDSSKYLMLSILYR